MRSTLLTGLMAWLISGYFSVAAAASQAHYRLPAWPASLPTPNFSLLDESGKTRSLADFQGRILLLFFGFTRCPDVCPTELLKLAQVMQALGPVSRRVQLVFITLDPSHDTPADLKRYLANFDPRFTALTGSVAQIDDTARRFSVDYAPVVNGANYTLDHSTSTFVLDRHGKLRLIGARANRVEDFVHDLRALADE